MNLWDKFRDAVPTPSLVFKKGQCDECGRYQENDVFYRFSERGMKKMNYFNTFYICKKCFVKIRLILSIGELR